MVAGFDWSNLRTVAELSRIKITQPMMARLRKIESLLIKESVESGNQRNQATN